MIGVYGKIEKYIFVIFMVVLIGVSICACGTESKEEQGQDKAEKMTIEEYLQNCKVVTLEDIARNPQNYIGENIVVEGDLGETFGVLSIGLWSSVNPLTIEYDGLAYDENFQVIGNILDTDYGYVAGQLIASDKIKAEIVIVSETKGLFENGYSENTNSGSWKDIDGFIGLSGTYVCISQDGDSATGKIEILRIENDKVKFDLGALSGPGHLMIEEAKIVDNRTIVLEKYDFILTFTWTDAENMTVTRTGSSTGDGYVDEITDNQTYTRPSEFNR